LFVAKGIENEQGGPVALQMVTLERNQGGGRGSEVLEIPQASVPRNPFPDAQRVLGKLMAAENDSMASILSASENEWFLCTVRVVEATQKTIVRVLHCFVTIEHKRTRETFVKAWKSI